jgi:hypothetical protein
MAKIAEPKGRTYRIEDQTSVLPATKREHLLKHISNHTHAVRQSKKHVIDEAEDKDRKRQRCDAPPTDDTDRNERRQSEEPSAIQFAPPTIVEYLPMDVDAADISHETNNSRLNTASASMDQRVHIPAAHDAPILDPASQSQATAIPSKRRYPFGRDEARKRKKTGRYIDVRIYAERKDLEHTHEIRCALTPDGRLDLVSLSQKMNLTACQASRLDIIPKMVLASLSATGSRCQVTTLVWRTSCPGKGCY